MRGALLVAGTASGVGKSVVVAGMCRWLARRGVRVAPFKAQNMSLNSAVTPGGAEIGRAQFAQAQAARVVPEAAMNPVLLKPTTEQHSQVVVMGKPLTDADARDYLRLKPRLLPVVLAALGSLRERFDVVVCEGAGSLAEINLRQGDVANMGLARAAGIGVLVVADIERGGAFGSLFGSLALLSPEDQSLVGGFLLNRFRGHRGIVQPAIDELIRLTARPVLGVLPWIGGLWLDEEDSMALDERHAQPSPPLGRDCLTVAVVRLPHISNFTDADALAAEPGVVVRFTASPAEIAGADLAVLPGTKSTVADLRWLRSRRIDEALRHRAARGQPVLGVCGGYQMLGRRIVDRVESAAGAVGALRLLPVETVFARDKLLGQSAGIAPGFAGAEVRGYEIRHGRVRVRAGEPLFVTPRGEEGCRVGAVLGTSWHGVFENDDFRRAFLCWVAELRGRDWIPGSRPFADVREARLDVLGDLIEQHADTCALERLIEEGAREERGVLRPHLDTGAAVGSLVDHGALRAHGDRMVPAGHLDFAVNVWPEGPPRWLREELATSLERVSSYPDEADAGAAAAARHGRRAEEVLVVNGAAEAFWLVAAALRPRRPVIVHPTFTEPEAALRAYGLGVMRVFRDPETFALNPAAVPADADLVVVGNPNNPTGNLEAACTIAALARPGRVVVVDEAFMDFCLGEPESIAPRAELPGVVVVRSLTKLWSLPGLRAGYLLGPAELVARLREMRQPWPVNTLALRAIAACTRMPDEARRRAEDAAAARALLVAELCRISGVRVWPSAANFVLLQVGDGPALHQALNARGIAVRPAATFPGLSSDYLRVAVRTPEDNEQLVRAVRASL